MSNEVIPVLPPEGACCANDLWDIVLPAEVEAVNYLTHGFYYDEDGGRCGACDSRSGGQWSRFACKYETPEAISFEEFAKFGTHYVNGKV